jgi:surface antigen
VSKKADKSVDKAAGKDKKGKKKGKGEDGGSGVAGASVANHPRARASVRRAKGWGGLIGFGIAAYLSLQAGVPAADAGLRALGAGVVGYVVAWTCAVAVWRHLVVAEMRAAYERAAQHGIIPGATGSSGSGAIGSRR